MLAIPFKQCNQNGAGSKEDHAGGSHFTPSGVDISAEWAPAMTVRYHNQRTASLTMAPRLIQADPRPPVPPQRMGIVKRYLNRRWRPQFEEPLEDLLSEGAGSTKGSTDYDDYVRRLVRKAEEEALKSLIDDEAEVTDEDSESELEDKDAPEWFEEAIEDADDEDGCEVASMDVEPELETNHLDLEEVFGSDWEDDD